MPPRRLPGMDLSLIHISIKAGRFCLPARRLRTAYRALSSFSSASLKLPAAAGFAPVSYTHLDVYKRQSLANEDYCYPSF